MKYLITAFLTGFLLQISVGKADTELSAEEIAALVAAYEEQMGIEPDLRPLGPNTMCFDYPFLCGGSDEPDDGEKEPD
jgi:hypothetical protein